MSLNVGSLSALLELDDRPFDRTLDQAGGKFGGLTKAAGVAAVGIGGALAGGAVKGLQAFAGFESGMNEVFTLLPGMSEKAMGDMSDQAKGFAREFGVLPDKVVPALYQSLSAGVPPDNVFTFLETAQKAAKGGVADLETAVDGISSVVNAYGDDVISAAGASDLMFTAVRLGKTNFEELSASLSNVTPIASALGVGFEDVTAALATMTAKGTPTAVATTQLRQLFVELSKEGGAAAKTFEHMAGKSFQQFVTEGGNTAQALDLMKQAAEDSGVQLQDLFGSVEAGSAALSLANGEGFAANLEEMAGAAGATDAAFATMDRGLKASWDKIMANAAVAAVSVGEWLAPGVEAGLAFAEEHVPKVRDAFANAVDRITGLVDDLRAGFEDRFGPIGDILSRFGEVVGEVVDRVTSWFRDAEGQVGDSSSRMGEIVGQLSDMFSAYFDAIVAVVSTAVQVVLDLWNRFGSDLVKYVTESFDNALQIISGALDVITGVFDVFAGIFTGDWSRVWEGVQGILGGVWDVMVGIVEQALNLLNTVIQVALGAISGVWSWAWNAMKTFVSDVWAQMVGVVRTQGEQVIGFVAGLPGRIAGAIGDLGGILFGAGKALMRGLLNGIKEGFEAVAGFAGGIAGRIADLKGPLDYDARVLVPAGLALMGGLERGIDIGLGSVLHRVSAIAPSIERTIGSVAGPSTSAPGSSGGTPAGGRSTSRTVNNTINVNYPPDVPSMAAVGHELRMVELGNP